MMLRIRISLIDEKQRDNERDEWQKNIYERVIRCLADMIAFFQQFPENRQYERHEEKREYRKPKNECAEHHHHPEQKMRHRPPIKCLMKRMIFFAHRVLSETRTTPVVRTSFSDDRDS